jgi:nicotinamide riboside transporter PnuC
MLFLIVLICFYLFQNGIILNVVFGVLLLILVLANQKKTNNYFIQVIKEGLFMDVFYSNRRHEVLTVFS